MLSPRVAAGGGYTAMANAIHKGPEAVKALLEAGADPNEVMTGGARPLHTVRAGAGTLRGT